MSPAQCRLAYLKSRGYAEVVERSASLIVLCSEKVALGGTTDRVLPVRYFDVQQVKLKA